MRRFRLSARGRLALLYTGLVLAAGALLSGLTYLLVRNGLKRRVMVGVNTGPDAATREQLPDTDEMAAIGRRIRIEALSELLSQAAIALAVVTLVAAALGWFVAGRVLRPLRTITATAGRLSAEHLSERVPVRTPADELASLATTINRMLDRIETGVVERERLLDSQRMFTANAAHELRTPLTTMRTAIDVTLDGTPTRAELLAMAADISAAVDNSRRTLDGLLALARSQAGPIDARPVDLAGTVEHVVGAAGRAAERSGIAVHTVLRPCTVDAEPVLVERMVGNLVDNALRYNRPGGHVSVRTGSGDGHSFLRVANTGPQLAAAEADRLLEPFVRGAGVRTHGDGGAGLGLSIVRAIVHAHHGEVTAVARDGGGLDVTVRLPARERDSPRLPAQPSSAAANAATASKSASCKPRCGSTRWSSARPP
ncbi:HAMP domain-containing histidine kinase [Streptomycetaceae bacterium NBC_01309]